MSTTQRQHPASSTQEPSGNCNGRPIGPVYSTVTVSSAVAVTAAVGADAVSSDTLTEVGAYIEVVNRGLVTFATGHVTATAAASSSDGTAPYVAASLVMDITGADLVSYKSTEHYGFGTTASHELSLDFIAIDVTWLTAEITRSNEQVALESVSAPIVGNTARFVAVVTAEGENSFTNLAADAFAMEDLLSSSYLTASAGSSVTATYDHVLGTRQADTIVGGPGSTIVFSGAGKDWVTTKNGADWIFTGDGDDRVDSGGGDDAVFAGAGQDIVAAGAGNDWLFGGRGKDDLAGNGGDDLLLGDAGDDCLDGGLGNDLLHGGTGKDRVQGGAGNDVFRLGVPRGDDNDVYIGGSGADIFWITDSFDDDVVDDFRLADGDRLMHGAGNWETNAQLMAHNGVDLALFCSTRDSDDLIVTFRFGRSESSLLLDEFFALNPGFNVSSHRGPLSDAQALPLLQAIFGDASDMAGHSNTALFAIADLLSELG